MDTSTTTPADFIADRYPDYSEETRARIRARVLAPYPDASAADLLTESQCLANRTDALTEKIARLEAEGFAGGADYYRATQETLSLRAAVLREEADARREREEGATDCAAADLWADWRDNPPCEECGGKGYEIGGEGGGFQERLRCAACGGTGEEQPAEDADDDAEESEAAK
jgi:hypothetical protein